MLKKILLINVIGWVLAGTGLACDKGCYEFEGNCACDEKPEQAPSVKPSDEKPPRSGMPAFESGNVKAAMPQSLIYQDSKADQEKEKANAEGKKAAGLQ